jgi:hypothetical protein
MAAELIGGTVGALSGLSFEAAALYGPDYRQSSGCAMYEKSNRDIGYDRADVIVKVASYAEYARFSKRLRKLGFPKIHPKVRQSADG